MHKKSMGFLVLCLFTVPAALSCEFIVTREPRIAQKCELTFIEHNVNILCQPNIRHQKHNFENTNFSLTYYKKNERGVIHCNGEVIQRLQLNDPQFSNIQTSIKKNSSFTIQSSCKRETRWELKSPLFIIVRNKDSFSFYKIHYVTKNKPLPIDEAGYNSDNENLITRYNRSKEQFRSDGKMLLGVAVGALGFTAVWLAMIFGSAYFFLKKSQVLI
jgi:hypothetical protein